MIAKQTGKILIPSSLILLAMLTATQQKAWSQYNQATLPGKGVAGPVTDQQHSFADQAFVKMVMERDAADLQLAQLAQQKSQSDDVKQLGEKITATRTGLDGQFKVLAKNLDVTEPKGPTKKDKQLIAKLESLSGPQFDEEWIKALGKIHRQDVKDFQTEAATAQEPAVLQVAKSDADILSKDLQQIQQVAQAHNVPVDDKK